MDSFPYTCITTVSVVIAFVFGFGVGAQSQMPDLNAKVCSQLYEKKRGYETCLKRKDINKNIGMIRSIDNDR